VKSEDSDGNNSFSGISKLFEIEDEGQALKDLSSYADKQQKVKPGKTHTQPLPPKKPPRNVHGKGMGITPSMSVEFAMLAILIER